MPAWMSLLHGSVASCETPLYARQFLVKAVLHVEARHSAHAAAAAASEESEVIPVAPSCKEPVYPSAMP